MSRPAGSKERLVNLSVMYRATQAISHVLDIDTLSPQILELVFESIGADRGAILLKDENGRLVPKAVRWREAAEPDERMTISRTIVDYVLEQGQGVITTDARPTSVRPRAVDRRLPYPRGDLRAHPGAAHHAGRALRRYPGRRGLGCHGRGKPAPARQVLPGSAHAHGRHRPPGRAGHRKHRPSTTTRSRPSGWPPSARRSPRCRTTSRTSSRASAVAATSSTWA